MLSAREWEPALAQAARTTGLVRLVARAYEPSDLDRLEVDVVIAGAETAWITPSFIRSWRRSGGRLLGLHPPNDRPAQRLLLAGGADEVLPDSTPPELILRTTQTLQLPEQSGGEAGHLIAVTGPRGAPGISEVALALAWGLAAHQRTLLLDVDGGGPSLSVRLGVDPFPDLAAAADRVLESGVLPRHGIHRVGPLSLLAVPPRSGPLASSLVREVIRAATHSFSRIVADLGPITDVDPLLEAATSTVLTCEATPKGLVRAALVTDGWTAPPPKLVLNRVLGASEADAVAAARRWLGLEPAVVIPETAAVGEAARTGRPPAGDLVELLKPLHEPTVGDFGGA